MAKVAPFHTNSPGYPPKHQELYHDHDNCEGGKRIQPKHREKGTGGKKRCEVYIKLG
jgi:hypothetical protein